MVSMRMVRSVVDAAVGAEREARVQAEERAAQQHEATREAISLLRSELKAEREGRVDAEATAASLLATLQQQLRTRGDGADRPPTTPGGAAGSAEGSMSEGESSPATRDSREKKKGVRKHLAHLAKHAVHVPHAMSFPRRKRGAKTPVRDELGV